MSHREYLDGDYSSNFGKEQILIAQKPHALPV